MTGDQSNVKSKLAIEWKADFSVGGSGRRKMNFPLKFRETKPQHTTKKAIRQPKRKKKKTL